MNLKNEFAPEELIKNRLLKNPISRREFLLAGAGFTAFGAAILSSCGKTVKVSETKEQEEISNPNVKRRQLMIIDTHTHFYDPARPQGVPWPNPKDEILYRTVLPEDYKSLALPEGVKGTVVVEASGWLEDNQWILDLAENEPFIVGFVGNLPMGSQDFGSNLERFAANPIFRGIRQGGGSIKNIENETYLADIEKLAAKDLELDLLIGADVLPDVVSLSKRVPELRIVINHIASVRIDGRAPDPEWVQGIRMVAEYPNIYCKVSALVAMAQERPTPDEVGYYAPTLDILWDAFGEDRLIYGSDWPVSARFADYATVQRIVMEYFKTKGQAATEKYFWQNSKAAYKWIVRD